MIWQRDRADAHDRRTEQTDRTDMDRSDTDRTDTDKTDTERTDGQDYRRTDMT